jgi:diguanylate cyclase (GGDEF)-like protein
MRPWPIIALRSAFAMLAVGTLAYLVRGLAGGGEDGLFEPWLYLALMAGAAALVLLRGALVRPERSAWLTLGVAVALSALGDAVWDLHVERLDPQPYPSVADAVWLASYPATYAGLALLLRARLRTWRPTLWLDGVIGGLTAGAVGAAVVFAPVLAATEGDPATVAVTLAYPLADLVTLLFVVAAFGVLGWRPGRSWALVGLGLMLFAVADAIYVFQDSTGTYVGGGWLDALWPAGALAMATAAWQRPDRRRRRDDGWAMVVVPAIFALGALGVLIAADLGDVSDVAVALAAGAVLLTLVRGGLTLRENLRLIARGRRESLTDGLTELANRRAVMLDLEEAFAQGLASGPRTLAFFDLDGFKRYNDAFGHAAGDALLTRLGHRLSAVVSGRGTAYRLGGDEFCVVLEESAEREGDLVRRLAATLSERGDGFDVTSSVGVIDLHGEAASPADALQIADARMYAEKDGRRGVGRHQARDVLLQTLSEREPELHEHMRGVGELALRVARRIGMHGEALDEVVRGAELHDVGKMAVPDAILHKPAALDPDEWAFVHQHTIIGERILAAAPALRPVALLVRSSHERWDGRGYPDGLAGEAIPVGARIIGVCDAYDAMRTDRPYRRACTKAEALVELRRCAGTQFDPAIVEAFCAEIGASSPEPLPQPA